MKISEKERKNEMFKSTCSSTIEKELEIWSFPKSATKEEVEFEFNGRTKKGLLMVIKYLNFDFGASISGGEILVFSIYHSN